MNIGKLVRRNLSLPISQRISADLIRARVASGMARVRGNMFVLMAQIHREIEPKLTKMKNAELALSREARCDE